MKNLLPRFLLMISKISLGCLLGCVMLLVYASHSTAVRQEIKRSVQKMFKEDFDCDWDGQIESIDLLKLRLELSNVSILPCDQTHNWSLYTHTLHISASLFDLVFHHKLSCHAIFDQAIVYEKQEQNRSHFMQLLSNMFSSQLPSNISFDYITIKQARYVVQDASKNVHANYTYNCQMSRERDGLHIKLYLLDGTTSYKDFVCLQNCTGNIVAILPFDNDTKEMYIRVDCRFSIPAIEEKGTCFIVGDLYRGRGAFVVSNEDQSFIIEPLKIKVKTASLPVTCSITMQSHIIQQLIAKKIIDADITGDVTISVQGDLLQGLSGLQGQLQIAHFAYKNNRLFDQVCLNFNKKEDGYATQCSVDKNILFEGSCRSVGDDFVFDVNNVASLQPWWSSYWNIPAGQGMITGTVQPELYQAQTEYQFGLHSAKLHETANVQGTCSLNRDEFRCSGIFLDKQYSCIIKFAPTPHVVELKYSSEQEAFIDLHEHQDPEQGTVGFVGFNWIKNLIPDAYKSSFSQPGQFSVQGTLQKTGYCAQINAHDAHIRMPFLYNVIDAFKATARFDYIDRSVIIDNMIANLYEGTVRCDRALFMFSTKTQPAFMHAPLFLDNVLMNWTKGIFGIVSGRLFLSLQEGQVPELQGNLIVDKAQLQGNIFSQEFQEQLVGAMQSSQGIDLDGNFDITIETKEPIAVQTSFLKAMVHLDLHVGNSFKQPEIEGTIDITSGQLQFPYKPLTITHGQISIMPKKSTEPTIEFVAKGKIKRYEITMRATGTMLDQQIHFESSPYLTEEQIVALLLVGSQDNSLSVVMPAMFMQKLQEIVFGPAISKSKLDVMFHRLLQSFKNIRIFPQFTNQTGRGGIRGVIEVDATDRLQGRMDSNLMQLEDTIFEADYLLTDDVTMRAIKDGPSTYGGEVEMRWKFS